jgi:glutamate carboxypeptidase
MGCRSRSCRKGGAPAPVVGLFTDDEEIGSPEGRAVIEAEARPARAVFNSEPGRVSGNVVTCRKGGVFMGFRLTGKAAHSGGNFSEDISAMEEPARKILAIHPLTDLDRGERRFGPGSLAELTIRGEFLPLTQSRPAKRLFEVYVDAAATSGFRTDGEFTGGCATSGSTAAVGAPAICAVGPVGGNAHSPDQCLRIDTLVPRAQACARAILGLIRAGL